MRAVGEEAADLGRLKAEFRKARAAGDAGGMMRSGRPLVPLLEKAGLPDLAEEVALDAAVATDAQGSPAEAVAAADEALRMVALARAGRMNAWDWMLKSKLAGLAVKNQLALGCVAEAQRRQAEAWAHLQQGIRLETGGEWSQGSPVPAGLSEALLDILLRNVCYDCEILCGAGRNVEAVSRLVAVDRALDSAGRERGHHALQLLHLLAHEQKFLGFWRDSCATQDRVLEMTKPGSFDHDLARANRAYWRSQFEGPEPVLLAEVRDSAARLDALGNVTMSRATRRILAKMGFAYREAGFDIGDLAAVVKEAEAAGDRMDAIYARRDLAVIQRRTGDFRQAEAGLLAGLAALRATGRKCGEPSVYKEYGELLRLSGRTAEAVRMFGEAIRLTKSFRWTQHLPGLLHVLALAQNDAGDAAGLKATLAELEALVKRGKLEPERRLDAGVALAVCLQALGRTKEAAGEVRRTVADGRAATVPEWRVTWAQKYPLGEIKPAQPAAATQTAADLQPLSVASVVAEAEAATARFTLSNPGAAASAGRLVVEGAHLEARWRDEASAGRISLLAEGGEGVVRHEIRLLGNEEYLLICEAGRGVAGQVRVRWEPVAGPSQQAEWKIERDSPDGHEVGVTNASFAERNAFYALRLHHSLARRGGDPAVPVDMRVAASSPVRIEVLAADSGDLLAVDANGDGSYDGPGDFVMSDTNHDGTPDFTCEPGRPVEVELRVFSPGGGAMIPAEMSLDVQLRGADGWATAARDVLRGKAAR